MKTIKLPSGPMCDKHNKHEKPYGEWMIWAGKQKRVGIRQRKCKVCGYWFWPDEY